MTTIGQTQADRFTCKPWSNGGLRMRGDVQLELSGLNLIWTNGSYAQKLVTVRLGGFLKLLDPVFELNPLNDFGQSVCAAELSPFLLG